MQKIIEIFEKLYHMKNPLRVDKICGDLSHLPKEEIISSLDILEKNRVISKTKDYQYYFNKKSRRMVGILELNRQGFGFVVLPDEDSYIPRSKIGHAMNGDIVIVKIIKDSGRRLSGIILKVLSRANLNVIGKLTRIRQSLFVIPSDKRVNFEIFIPEKSKAAAKEDQIVVTKIIKYPDKSGRIPEGEIVEVLGNEWDAAIQVEIIIREHNLKTEFDVDVLEECKKFTEPTNTNLSGRKDYRDLLAVTIDGADAKDFDDAVYVEKKNSGYKLIVLIADVTHYVTPDSFTFNEAHQRATSVYLVDRVIPMLPEKLSNGLCSLIPDKDRLCMAVEMDITSRGELADYHIFKGVMRSKFRLIYDDVDAFFNSGNSNYSPELEDMLLKLKELSNVLEKKRLRRGSIEFESVEAKIILDASGNPVEILTVSETSSRKLIEESMILANEVVATHLKQNSIKYESIYRIHQEPDLDTIARLSAILETLGHPSISDNPTSMDLQKVVKFAHNLPEKLLINTLLLRAMQQARYSTLKIGHFGLASDCYTHFTSPIRRFPDLIVHLLLKDLMMDTGMKAITSVASRLSAIAEHSSLMEREAAAADRESVEVKICEYMSKFIGTEFDGIISSVMPFGFFVELENIAEGLVRIHSLTDDNYMYNEDNLLLTGNRTGKNYKLGQKVRVKLKRANIGERQLDFELVEQ